MTEHKRNTSLKYWKITLSMFVVIHIAAITLTPHGQNYVAYSSNSLLSPYIGFFELGSAWSYFAPDPGPPPFYVDYQAYDPSGQEIASGRWPDPNWYPLLTERKVRLVGVSRYIASDDDKLMKVLIPYFCKKVVGAKSIRLTRVVFPIPPLMEVAEGKRRVGDEKIMDSRPVGFDFCEAHP